MGAGAGGGHFRNEDRGGTDGKESLEEGWEQRERAAARVNKSVFQQFVQIIRGARHTHPELGGG